MTKLTEKQQDKRAKIFNRLSEYLYHYGKFNFIRFMQEHPEVYDSKTMLDGMLADIIEAKR